MSVSTQPVIQDVGSEELKKLRLSYNALLDAVSALMDELEVAGAIGDVNTAAVNFKALLEAAAPGIVKVGGEPGVGQRPSRPLQGV